MTSKIAFILLCVLLTFYSCSKIQIITVREKGILLQRYQVFRKSKIQEGYEKFYFENGAVDGAFVYKDGQLDGDFIYYYEGTGIVKQKGRYIKGKMEGMLYTYYSNGQLKEEVLHAGGLTEGSFKEYNDTGVLQAVGEYTHEDGMETLEQGLLQLYDEQGVLIKKMLCRTGQCCTIWTLKEGAVRPSSKLCVEIIESQK